MAHQIEPDDGEFLERDEVVARLRDSLEYVQVSKQDGESASAQHDAGELVERIAEILGYDCQVV